MLPPKDSLTLAAHTVCPACDIPNLDRASQGTQRLLSRLGEKTDKRQRLVLWLHVDGQLLSDASDVGEGGTAQEIASPSDEIQVHAMFAHNRNAELVELHDIMLAHGAFITQRRP